MAQMYWGDFLSGDTIELHYFSFNSLGASATPSSAGSVVVYKTGSATQTSVGVVTHSLGYDSQTGFNRVVVNSLASAAFYAPGTDFTLFASGSSLDGQFVNIPIGTFSIQNRYQAGLIHRGTAGGGGAASVTLDANVRSGVTDLYNGATPFLSASTGVSQAREGTAYAGATGVLTVGRNWITNPESGTSYELYAGSASMTTGEIMEQVNSGVTVTSLSAGALSSITAGLPTLTQLNSGVTVASIAANAITATAIASNAITAAKIAASSLDSTKATADFYNEAADKFLGRGIAGGNSSSRSVSEALFALRNKIDATGSTKTVYKTDDTTAAWTFSATTAAFPFGTVDPS